MQRLVALRRHPNSRFVARHLKRPICRPQHDSGTAVAKPSVRPSRDACGRRSDALPSLVCTGNRLSDPRTARWPALTCHAAESEVSLRRPQASSIRPITAMQALLTIELVRDMIAGSRPVPWLMPVAVVPRPIRGRIGPVIRMPVRRAIASPIAMEPPTTPVGYRYDPGGSRHGGRGRRGGVCRDDRYDKPKRAQP